MNNTHSAIKDTLGFPSLAFPLVQPTPTRFFEPPSFTSPEVSARMANTINTCKLEDFNIKKQTRDTQSASMKKRFDMKGQRSTKNNLVRKHLLSLDNQLRMSSESASDYGRMTLPSSKMNRTVTAGMSSTVKGRFMGHAGDKQTIKIRNHLVDPMTTLGNQTLTTIDPQWHNRENNSAKARRYGSLQLRQQTTQNTAQRVSIEEGRPSLMGESFAMSQHATIRNPYKQKELEYNLKSSVGEFTVGARGDEILGYSLGNQTAMGPNARQKDALDKIQMMSMKARGKLKPGQPTAKQYAEQQRQANSIRVPDEYGNHSPFLHNNTAKPIKGYHFQKFKQMHQMRGIELDKTAPDKKLARALTKQRTKAKHEKSIFDRQQTKGNVMKFKDTGDDLYSAEDKSRLAQGLKPLKPGESQETQTESKESTSDSSSSSELMDAAEQRESLLFDLATMPEDLTHAAAHILNQNLHNLRSISTRKQYDLWNGKKNVDQFVKQLSLHVAAKKPDVNISEIVEQYNDPEKRYGLPYKREDGKIEKERPKIIFRDTLRKETQQLFGKNTVAPKQGPATFLTSNETDDKQTKKRIDLSQERDESPPGREFQLHKYSLNQLKESYYSYKKCHDSLVEASQGLKKYKVMKDKEVVNITDQDIINEIRKNPNLGNVAKIVKDPLCFALIRMLITYEKYNYETQEQGIVQASNTSQEDKRSIFAKSMTNPPFKEIELMKELVLEIGDAISNRIKDDSREKSQGLDKGEEEEKKPHVELISGQDLNQRTRKNNYHQIDRYIAMHPEFEQIKEEAKKKVLARVNKFRQKQVSNAQSIMGAIPGLVRLDTIVVQKKETLTEKQKQILEPKRKSLPKRTKITLQQFVQSSHFQDVFTDLIQKVDSKHKQRKEQNRQASQHMNKHVFYKLAKDSVTNNTASNPNIEYMHNCYENQVNPFPIFSKIRCNVLKLIGYNLNEGYCNAMENFLNQQSSEEALIEKIVLHQNSATDGCLAAVLRGLQQNSKLRHLHYSSNEFGQHSNIALLKMLQNPQTTLQSLVLSNLKTTGKAVQQQEQEPFEPIEENKEGDDNKVVAIQETPLEKLLKKQNIIHELTMNILHTESLMNLVLTDMPMGERAQQNLVLFAEKSVKIENFQLINCQMLPQWLIAICEQLETQQDLQCLSFRKNVLNNRDQKREFCQALTTLIINAGALVRLDISGMFIGDAGITQIMCEGVAVSEYLASVNFTDNKTSHWNRLKIFATLTGIYKKLEALQEERERQPDNVQAQAQAQIEAYEAMVAVCQPDEEIDQAIIAQYGIYQLQDQRYALMDQYLDSDTIDEKHIITNIQEMVEADLPLIKFPESQMLVDADHVKETKINPEDGPEVSNRGTIDESERGTLYNRISQNPKLFKDKVEIAKWFGESPWLSISRHTGCWICNSNKILDRLNKKKPEAVIDELTIKAGQEVMQKVQKNLVDFMVEAVATEQADKKVIAENPGLVEVINTTHKNATQYLINDILDEVAEETVEKDKRCILPFDRIQVNRPQQVTTRGEMKDLFDYEIRGTQVEFEARNSEEGTRVTIQIKQSDEYPPFTLTHYAIQSAEGSPNNDPIGWTVSCNRPSKQIHEVGGLGSSNIWTSRSQWREWKIDERVGADILTFSFLFNFKNARNTRDNNLKDLVMQLGKIKLYIAPHCEQQIMYEKLSYKVDYQMVQQYLEQKDDQDSRMVSRSELLEYVTKNQKVLNQGKKQMERLAPGVNPFEEFVKELKEVALPQGTDYSGNVAEEITAVIKYAQIFNCWHEYMREQISGDTINKDQSLAWELHFWKQRRLQLKLAEELLTGQNADLRYQRLQLGRERMKNQLGENYQLIWDAALDWKDIVERVKQQHHETKHSVQQFTNLEPFLQPLYQVHLFYVQNGIGNMMKKMKTFNNCAQYYNTTERMTSLFVKIADQIITNCKFNIVNCGNIRELQGLGPLGSIGSLDDVTNEASDTFNDSGLWDDFIISSSQDLDRILEVLKICKEIREVYGAQYQKAKNEVEQSESRKFNFSQQVIFGNFDLFTKRVETLIQFLEYINQVRQSRQDYIQFSPSMKEWVDYLDSFRKVMVYPRLLDHTDETFEREFKQFEKDMTAVQRSNSQNEVKAELLKLTSRNQNQLMSQNTSGVKPKGIARKKGRRQRPRGQGMAANDESELETESDNDKTPLWVPYLAHDEEEQRVDYMQVRKGADPPLGTISSDYYKGYHPDELYNESVFYWGKAYLKGVLPYKIGQNSGDAMAAKDFEGMFGEGIDSFLE